MIGNDSNAPQLEREVRCVSPNTIQTSLQDFDRELKGMFSFGDTALRRARVQCPGYVDDPAFRLRFLRAEQFHIKRAATFLLRHFEEKKLLFGEHCLGRDITLPDLNDDDLAYLECGGHQISPCVDRHGRCIEICNLHLLNSTDTSSKISEVSTVLIPYLGRIVYVASEIDCSKPCTLLRIF
jgi:hypothetical protein